LGTKIVSEIVQGFDGDTILVPEVPPGDGWTPTPIKIPPFPEWPDIVIPSIIAGDVFVPPVGGVNTTPNPDEAIYWRTPDVGYASFALINSTFTKIEGVWKIPSGVGSVTVYPLFTGNYSTGFIYISHTIEYGACGIGQNEVTNDSFGITPVYFDDLNANEGNSYWVVCDIAGVALSSPVGGDFCTLTFTRDAVNVADTYEEDIFFYGWWIVYG
jgi:hypothetical protein